MKKTSTKNKKIIVGIISLILVIFIGKVIYACTYVDNIVVTYPWDDYSVFEKIASTLTGLGRAQTRQELYDSHLISSINEDAHKFNSSYVNEKKLGSSGQKENYEKLKKNIANLSVIEIDNEVNKGNISVEQGEDLKKLLKK